MRTIICCTVLLAALPIHALAQADLAGTDRFPQFRNLSGLGCGGYGLDAQGFASLSGPTAFSTPVAYVLGHDQFRIQYASISHNMSANVTWGKSNNKLVGVYGHTFGPVNVAVSDIVLSRVYDQAFNIQAELIPQRHSRYAVSAGIQDIGGGGGSSGTGVPGDDHNSRSFFGVVTYRATEGLHPVYLSAGIGSRRFRNGFVNTSVQIASPVRLWTEWDGFGLNYGALLAYQQHYNGRIVELDFIAAVVDSRYMTLGFGFGF